MDAVLHYVFIDVGHCAHCAVWFRNVNKFYDSISLELSTNRPIDFFKVKDMKETNVSTIFHPSFCCSSTFNFNKSWTSIWWAFPLVTTKRFIEWLGGWSSSSIIFALLSHECHRCHETPSDSEVPLDRIMPNVVGVHRWHNGTFSMNWNHFWSDSCSWMKLRIDRSNFVV